MAFKECFVFLFVVVWFFLIDILLRKKALFVIFKLLSLANHIGEWRWTNRWTIPLASEHRKAVGSVLLSP